MNSISWFLYLASFADKITGIAAVWGILLSLVVVMATVAWIVVFCTAAADKDAEKTLTLTTHIWKVFVGWLIVMGVLYSVTPDSKTMYAIAASQVGEQVVKSEAAQGIANDATKALQQWIKRQLDPPPAKHDK